MDDASGGAYGEQTGALLAERLAAFCLAVDPAAAGCLEVFGHPLRGTDDTAEHRVEMLDHLRPHFGTNAQAFQDRCEMVRDRAFAVVYNAARRVQQLQILREFDRQDTFV